MNDLIIKRNVKCTILAFLCCLSVNAQQPEKSCETKTLSPQQTEKILRKVRTRLNKEYLRDAGKESRFYLSQTNLLNGKKSDVQEAVLNAQSNITLRNICVISGRSFETGETEVDTVPPYLVTTDLFHVFQLGPMIANEAYWHYTLTPFVFRAPVKGGTHMYDGFDYLWEWRNPPPIRPIREKYDIAGEIIEDSEGRSVLKVDMHREMPPPEVVKGAEKIAAKSILNGTMYIDMEKKRLLSFEGELTGYKEHCVIPSDGKLKTVRIPATCKIRTDYTHERGFTEIEHSECIVTCENAESRLFLSKLGPETDKRVRKVQTFNNLPLSIRKAGYNAELMESETVRKAMGQAVSFRQEDPSSTS